MLEHGTAQHRELALGHLLAGLLEYATNEQGSKSVSKALKEGGKDTVNKIVKRMCEPAKRFVPTLCAFYVLFPGPELYLSFFLSALGEQLLWTSLCLPLVVN